MEHGVSAGAHRSAAATARTMVLSPHLDDEVLGCFSFLGPDTFVVYCDLGDGADGAVRRQELASVASATGHRWEMLPGGLRGRSLEDLVAALEEAIARERPEVLLLPADSYHQDHRLVHQAGIAALRPHEHNHRVGTVMLFEQPQVVLWPVGSFRANAFREVDIEAKIAAYRLYASQVRRHRSEEILRAMATLRGSQVGLPSAEGFEMVRVVI